MAENGSFAALVAEEEQRDRADAGVRADDRADAVDHDGAVEVRECCFNEIGHLARVIVAGGFGNEAFSGVCRAAVCVALQASNDLTNHVVLSLDLLAREQLAEAVHVEQRADAED